MMFADYPMNPAEVQRIHRMSAARWAVWAGEGGKSVLERAGGVVRTLPPNRPAEHLSGS